MKRGISRGSGKDRHNDRSLQVREVRGNRFEVTATVTAGVKLVLMVKSWQ